MNSNALYYTRPCLEKLYSRLLSISGDPATPDLVFEETIFYPEGGGQPCDLGTIAGIPVLSVIEEDGRVVHRLSSPLPQEVFPGLSLELRLDGKRRRDHTEQHSGQHLLSATLLRLFSAPTRSFHLGPERSTIDIDCKELSECDQAEAEDVVNEAIATDYRFITHVCPPENLNSFALRRVPPKGEAVYHVVEIDGLDFTPCCGTHVRSTADLRLLLIMGAERYKGMTRVHFVAGDRAVRLARESVLASREASKILGCAPRETGAEVVRQAERLKTALSGRKAFLRAWANEKAGSVPLPGQLPEWPGPDGRGTGPTRIGRFVTIVLVDGDAEAALELAKSLAGNGRSALVASRTDLAVTSVSSGPGPDLDGLLGPPCGLFGGSGGGGAAFFRATFPSLASFDGFLSYLGKILQN